MDAEWQMPPRPSFSPLSQSSDTKGPPTPCLAHASAELTLWCRKTVLQSEELRQLLDSASGQLHRQEELLRQHEAESASMRKLVDDLLESRQASSQSGELTLALTLLADITKKLDQAKPAAALEGLLHSMASTQEKHTSALNTMMYSLAELQTRQNQTMSLCMTALQARGFPVDNRDPVKPESMPRRPARGRRLYSNEVVVEDSTGEEEHRVASPSLSEHVVYRPSTRTTTRFVADEQREELVTAEPPKRRLLDSQFDSQSLEDFGPDGEMETDAGMLYMGAYVMEKPIKRRLLLSQDSGDEL